MMCGFGTTHGRGLQRSWASAALHPAFAPKGSKHKSDMYWSLERQYSTRDQPGPVPGPGPDPVPDKVPDKVPDPVPVYSTPSSQQCYTFCYLQDRALLSVTLPDRGTRHYPYDGSVKKDPDPVPDPVSGIPTRPSTRPSTRVFDTYLEFSLEAVLPDYRAPLSLSPQPTKLYVLLSSRLSSLYSRVFQTFMGCYDLKNNKTATVLLVIRFDVFLQEYIMNPSDALIRNRSWIRVKTDSCSKVTRNFHLFFMTYSS